MSAETTPQGKYAKLTDLEVYYEIHGSGQPMVVLPGSFYTIEAMGPLVPRLAETRQVIAVGAAITVSSPLAPVPSSPVRVGRNACGMIAPMG